MRMLLERLLDLLPTIFGISVVTYILLALIPGDPILAMLGMDADPSAIAVLRAKYGLDQAIPIRFVLWLAEAVRGDLGRSIQSGRPVAALVLTALWPTTQLALAALFVSLTIGIPSGVTAAMHHNRSADIAVSAVAAGGISLPGFWVAIVLIILLSIRLHWLPSSGYVSFWQSPTQALSHIALPALTLGVALSSAAMRMTRRAMLEVLPMDYIRTARAKGLPAWQVTWRHAFRAALVPIVTLVGVQLGQMFGGVVVTETIFAWPGIGKLAVDAIFARDYPVLQGAILVTALAFLMVNLAVDLICARLDPHPGKA